MKTYFTCPVCEKKKAYEIEGIVHIHMTRRFPDTYGNNRLICNVCILPVLQRFEDERFEGKKHVKNN